MNFEWDENKRLSNIQKHKIDFVDTRVAFDDYTITFEDDRQYYGEQRFITFGRLRENIIAIVHTEKEDNIRIISVRKATKHEERNYYATISN